MNAPPRVSRLDLDVRVLTDDEPYPFWLVAFGAGDHAIGPDEAAHDLLAAGQLHTADQYRGLQLPSEDLAAVPDGGIRPDVGVRPYYAVLTNDGRAL